MIILQNFNHDLIKSWDTMDMTPLNMEISSWYLLERFISIAYL